MDIVLLTACVGKEFKLFRSLGTYQIAWYLRKFDYSVQVIDFIHRFSEDQIWKLIEKYVTTDTKILGYSPMINFSENGDFNNKIERILLRIKKQYPHIKIVAGGASAQGFVKRYRNKSLFDNIFIGHAEDTMLAFCNHIFRGAQSLSFEKLEGNNIIRETIPLPQITEKFNIADCTHTWSYNDFIQPKETLPIELGRGCIFACKFCQYPYIGKAKNDFTRNMELVREEMIQNYEKFGTTRYYMVDDTFNADRPRLVEFANMVKTLPFKLEYAAYLRLDLIFKWDEQEELLPESGLVSCFFGIESLNQQAADLVGKGWQNKKVKDYLPDLYHNKWKSTISPRIGLICGLPPETFDEMKDTHNWLVENKIPSWVWASLQIHRDLINTYTSEFERNAEKYGFTFENDNGKIIWRHQLYSERDAEDMTTTLNNISKPHMTPSWMPLLELGNYTENLNMYKESAHGNIDWEPIRQGILSFLKTYYLQLLHQSI